MSKMTSRSRKYFSRKKAKGILPFRAIDGETGLEMDYYFICDDGTILGSGVKY